MVRAFGGGQPPSPPQIIVNMSEQQPLLPVERSEASASHGATLTWREETSRILESRGLHKTVVALVG